MNDPKYKQFLLPSVNVVDGAVIYPKVKYAKTLFRVNIDADEPKVKKMPFHERIDSFAKE